MPAAKCGGVGECERVVGVGERLFTAAVRRTGDDVQN